MRAHLRAVARRPATAEIPFSALHRPRRVPPARHGLVPLPRAVDRHRDRGLADLASRASPCSSSGRPRTELHVLDILSPGMAAVAGHRVRAARDGEPADQQVGAQRAATSGGSSAASFVQNLQCTLEPRPTSIPYHRLPPRSLTPGRARRIISVAPRSTRPSARRLGPAAAERGAARLRGRRPRMVPARAAGARRAGGARSTRRTSDPKEIREQYIDVTGRLRERKARREDIRDAVRDHLLAGTSETLGGFRLYRRLFRVATIAELCGSRTSSTPATRSTS